MPRRLSAARSCSVQATIRHGSFAQKLTFYTLCTIYVQRFEGNFWHSEPNFAGEMPAPPATRTSDPSQGQMNGFLLVDKPIGISSVGAIKELNKRHSLQRKSGKVGHGGTLDPYASGLLVVAVGKATRLLRFFLGSDKRYVADFRFGERTATDDREGEVVATAPYAHVTRERLEEALCGFRGEIMQVPPVFSAVHVDGKRAYDLARSGREVELAPRPVTIHAIEILECALPDAPNLRLDIRCSGGTYIRSIARDLGRAVESEAYMAELRRTGACHFDIAQATPLDKLVATDDIESFLVPCVRAMKDFPQLPRKDDEILRLLRGLPVNFHVSRDGIYSVTGRGRLVAVLERKNGHNDFVRLMTDAEFAAIIQ